MKDIAGRHGLGLSMIEQHGVEQEITIKPGTYELLGAQSVATMSHTSVALDGTRQIHRGQVLGWFAILQTVVVERPGQT